MRLLLALVMTVLPLQLWAAEPRHAVPQLTAEYAVSDGRTDFWALFTLKIAPGWHSYWQNPGDSGTAPQLSWGLPPGVTAGAILWQPPERQSFGHLMNFGYSGTAHHLVRISLPERGLTAPSLPLRLKADWLVCAEECVPESAELELSLPLSRANLPAPGRAQIQALAQSAAPPSLPLRLVASDDAFFTIAVPYGAGMPPAAYFYPTRQGVTEPAAAQKLAWRDGALELTIRRGTAAMTAPLAGLLEIEDAAGRHFITVAQPPAAPDGQGLPALLLAAFLGGVILNAMPCVFPVLSLKLLALGRKSGKSRAMVRTQGIAYAAGVLASFAIVGAVFLMLRTGGQAIGWGYQMQQPLFVLLLINLLFLIGLNLSGFYTINVAYGGGEKLTQRAGWTGSFATGMLATVVATPCTAPFMAAALGAALVLPPLYAMLIFLMLGLGLAAPFLLLTWLPGGLRWLPKPGAWMERCKQFLAFPLYLSAIWLLWVLGRQSGADAVALALLGLTGWVFLIWAWPWLRAQIFALRLPLMAFMLAAAMSPFAFLRVAPVTQAAQDDAAFTPARLAALRAAQRPVFVYATADWCITCKLNESAALRTEQVQRLFNERHIVVLRADWTNADPAITAWLGSFRRSGVPLYVFYPAQGAPVVLPQLLTPAIVADNLAVPLSRPDPSTPNQGEVP